MSQQWQERNRPQRLERRYQFADYTALRDFLDRAAELADPAHLAGVEHAQELGLQWHGHVADLVEENRAAVSQLKPPAAVVAGIGVLLLVLPGPSYSPSASMSFQGK